MTGQRQSTAASERKSRRLKRHLTGYAVPQGVMYFSDGMTVDEIAKPRCQPPSEYFQEHGAAMKKMKKLFPDWHKTKIGVNHRSE